MERRALVIRTYGDPEIAGAIMDAVSRRVIPLDDDELAAVKAEYARLKSSHEKLESRDGVRQEADNKRWEAEKQDLARKYGTKQHSAAYGNFILIYALVSLTIGECCRRLAVRIRGGRCRK